MATLHVTNGDSAAEGLRQAQLGGNVLPWRDVLHDGPVPSTSSWAEFRATRARFLASRGAGTVEELEQSFRDRDDCLDQLSADDDVVLWFEPDLYDQLQLCEILARLAERDAASRPQASIAPADRLLGPLDAAGFSPLYANRRALSEGDIALGAAVWKEITCPDPASITKVSTAVAESQSGTRYAANPALTLPHLAPALTRWLEQLPSFENGLNRSEHQISAVLSSGPCSLRDCYMRSHHDVEEWIWLGDWSFAWYVQQMSEVAHPLVVFADGSRITTESLEPFRNTFGSRQVQLTDLGGDVLAGKADAVDVNGIDRWFGGAHLRTVDHWRWDAQTKLAVSRRSERRHQPRE